MNDSFHMIAPAVHQLKEVLHSHHGASWTPGRAPVPRIISGQPGRRDESSLMPMRVNAWIRRSFLFVTTQGLINIECAV